MFLKKRSKKISVGLLAAFLSLVLCACAGTKIKPGGSHTEGMNMNIGKNITSNKQNLDKTSLTGPFEVRAALNEKSAVDPETGTGVYVRYTELIPAEGLTG